jgi:hypothetical protein
VPNPKSRRDGMKSNACMLPIIAPLCRPYGTYAFYMANHRGYALGYIMPSLRDLRISLLYSSPRNSDGMVTFQNAHTQSRGGNHPAMRR